MPTWTWSRARSSAKTTPQCRFVAGLGVDWAVTPSIFLRAEWEYIAFATINGINATTNTGLVGAGVRF